MIFRRLKTSKQLIGIHLDSDEIKVLSLRQETEGCTVLGAVRTKRSGGDLIADLERIFKGDVLFRGQAVLVTDDVKFLSSDLGAGGGEKLSEEKLLAAASWEMEPYLDFPPSDGLFECSLQPEANEGETVPVLISAIFKKSYETIAGVLKRAGLDLVAAYAPQAAVACLSDLPESGKSKVLIDCGEESVKGVLLSENGPVVFQDSPITPGTNPSSEMIRDMLYGLGAQGPSETEIILSGKALDEELLEDLSLEFPLARAWGVGDIPGMNLDTVVVNFGPEYALAAGAALAGMGVFGKTIPSVTDRVPLGKAVVQKIRENRRFIPAAVLGCFVLCLGVHYGYTQLRISSYNGKIHSLEEERKNLEIPLAEKKRLKSELTKIEEKRAFVQDTLPAQNRHILVLLTALSEMIPPDVVVNKIDQRDTRTFFLKGNAYRGRAITDFNKALSSLESCAGAFLVSVCRTENASIARSKILPYDFTIRVLFGSEQDS